MSDMPPIPLFDLVKDGAELTPAADMRAPRPVYDLMKQGEALKQDPRKQGASKE